MNKLEQRLVEAIADKRDFEEGNTRVEFDYTGSYSVYLHNNRIAHYDAPNKTLYANWCGWVTNTTRNRLNAISSDKFNIKAGEPYVNGQLVTDDGRIVVNK